jgi:hypothetical protein
MYVMEVTEIFAADSNSCVNVRMNQQIVVIIL